MLKIVLALAFLSLETFADFWEGSISLFESSNPYVDLTIAIDQQNVTEIENTLNFTSNVYYSTNQTISDIANLSWVSSFLSEIYENNQTANNASLCLILSFQITKNGSDIDWRFINDVLNRPTKISEENTEEKQNLENLGQYLCQVILDFQVDDPKNVEYQRSQEYAERWDISFTKNAKLILETILNGTNNTIPVGVMYAESQIEIQDMILFEQEIRHADFIIVNVNHYPLTRAPLDDMNFYRYLDGIKWKNLASLSFMANNASYGFQMPFKFMLTWNNYKTNLDSNCPSCLAKDQVFLESQSIYQELFTKFVKNEIRYGNKDFGIISGVQLGTKQEEDVEFALRHSNYGYTYLHVQESDITACRLGSMLQDIRFGTNNLVVNEYTLGALAGFHNELTNDEISKAECETTYFELSKILKNLIVFPTPGIGNHWDQTGNTFSNLLRRSQRLENVTVSTLVFDANDLNSGTEKFISAQIAENKTKIGCLVDITWVMSHFNSSSKAVVDFVQRKCRSILKESTILVWQIQIDKWTESARNFTYYSDERSLKYKLIDMLVAKELYQNSMPNQEIMFRVTEGRDQIKRNKTECLGFVEHSRDRDLDELLIKWSALHQVKIMSVMPAFDLKTPTKGFNILHDDFQRLRNKSFRGCV